MLIRANKHIAEPTYTHPAGFLCFNRNQTLKAFPSFCWAISCYPQALTCATCTWYHARVCLWAKAPPQLRNSYAGNRHRWRTQSYALGFLVFLFAIALRNSIFPAPSCFRITVTILWPLISCLRFQTTIRGSSHFTSLTAVAAFSMTSTIWLIKAAL